MKTKNEVGGKWESVKIKDFIVKPISGEWGDGEGNINVIRTTNFTNEGKLDLSELVQRNIDKKKVEQKKLLFGDTIIEKSGGSPTQPVGRVVFFDQTNGTYLCNNFTSIIRTKSDLDPRFLFWFLFHNHLTKKTLQYQNKTTGIINLQLERYIDDLLIPLPPLATQQRIAAILDAADALRRKDQELLRKYDELAQGIFIDMFGDPFNLSNTSSSIQFKDLVTRLTYGFTRPMKHLPIGIPILTAKNIKNGFIDWVNVHYADDIEYNELTSKCKPEFGDILITKDGSIGRTALFDLDFPVCINQSVALIKPSFEKVEPQFLVAYLNLPSVQDKIQNMGKGGGLKHLQITELAEFPIISVNLDLQRDFLRKLKLISIQRANSDIGFQNSNSLFNSLLHQAFNGELV